ncbi:MULTISPECIES: hypothetical protein [Streptomyces]|uniref:Uncharacterized protein n=1 Tax=Streptomyces xanthochromogenes TaxID=67384 RepID=A0ABQ2ZE26_9ACTN|nr:MULTISPECIES: hypothetical protein [Streptomyces]MYV94044.1 hypothetical protein [Streptomyces sp. SID1034]GGY13766.1 hypothetical protein GCM10010326_01360 [Streptomyces xanthochromogenes]
MTELNIETRVEHLTRGLRRLASELLQVAAEHPDAARGRELSGAARVLTEGVLGRLDCAVVNAPAGPDPEVWDTVAGAAGGAAARVSTVGAVGSAPVDRAGPSGTAREQLVELYLGKYERWTEKPFFRSPHLSERQEVALLRLKWADGNVFATAPLWNDVVPQRGKRVRRLLHTKAERARRLHHCYVLDRDLDSPEGELAGQVADGCRAIQSSRVLRDGGFVEPYAFDRQMDGFRWRALVTAAGRGEHARTDLLAHLDRLEALAAAVLEADVAFRERNNGPAAHAKLTAASQAMTAAIQVLTA